MPCLHAAEGIPRSGEHERKNPVALYILKDKVSGRRCAGFGPWCRVLHASHASPLAFGRTRRRRRKIRCLNPAAQLNRVTPARQYQQPVAHRDRWGVRLVVTIARRLARPPRRGRTGHRRVHRRVPVVPHGCCGLPASTSSGSKRRPTPWRSAPERGGHVRASAAASERGHCHGPAPATRHRSAGRKVTNLLLIPPRAPLFRPHLPGVSL